MAVNPWTCPQKRVELPRYKQIVCSDIDDMKTLDTMLSETTIEFYCEPNDDSDYAVMNADGSVTRVCECVTINGTQWWLVPGKNQLPQTVYEFLVQCPEQRRRLSCPTANQASYLGEFRTRHSR